MTGTTYSGATLTGNTRKAWVDDLCGNTWSGKQITVKGMRLKAAHGGLSH